ncbi:hypothetical protein [Mycoplasmopsis felis]|uniref:hypothetical protein n=1 Tax=Mycoplasmopsis felis TaxID=33923 RepID=UPI0012EB2D81|nr:hypothetical protein [Mycoplasmopsis felis]
MLIKKSILKASEEINIKISNYKYENIRNISKVSKLRTHSEENEIIFNNLNRLNKEINLFFEEFNSYNINKKKFGLFKSLYQIKKIKQLNSKIQFKQNEFWNWSNKIMNEWNNLDNSIYKYIQLINSWKNKLISTEISNFFFKEKVHNLIEETLIYIWKIDIYKTRDLSGNITKLNDLKNKIFNLGYLFLSCQKIDFMLLEIYNLRSDININEIYLTFIKEIKNLSLSKSNCNIINSIKKIKNIYSQFLNYKQHSYINNEINNFFEKNKDKFILLSNKLKNEFNNININKNKKINHLILFTSSISKKLHLFNSSINKIEELINHLKEFEKEISLLKGKSILEEDKKIQFSIELFIKLKSHFYLSIDTQNKKLVEKINNFFIKNIENQSSEISIKTWNEWICLLEKLIISIQLNNKYHNLFSKLNFYFEKNSDKYNNQKKIDLGAINKHIHKKSFKNAFYLLKDFFERSKNVQ